MSNVLFLSLAFFAGAVLGVIFFAGLWWTVSKGLATDLAGLWFMGSLLLRTSIVMAGFYFVAHGHWDRMLVCLAGFAVARLVVARYLRPPRGISHAH